MKSLVLGSGLRVIVAPSPTNTTYCGICIASGTRNELETESGIAHFTEHLTFKGTRRRSSRQIINRMESVGGDLNAFTGKEETVFYCACGSEHLNRAMDLLFDVVLSSTYPQEEMDKEVEVVIDEIESYNDSPSELIYDDFEAMLFKGHPLGRNILGEAERLRQYRTGDIMQYVNRMYTLDRMVVFCLTHQSLSEERGVVTDIEIERITQIIENSLNKAISNSPRTTFMPQSPVVHTPLASGVTEERGWEKGTVLSRSTHQSHVMMGARAFGGNDRMHLPLYLANNILGGPGLSSRLNLALREKTGLVYTVESSITTYTDTGVWAVYFGCDKGDVKRCKRLVVRELDRLCNAPLTDRALAAAKRQMIGQMDLSYDNFESVAIGMGKRLLHYNRMETRDELVARIQAITAEETLSAVRQVFNPENLTTLEYE